MVAKPFILDIDFNTLSETLSTWGEPNYRAQQIWEGVYKHLWKSTDEFSNIPVSLRQKMDRNYSFSHLQNIKGLISRDQQSEKTLFELPDLERIETVLMKYEKRSTLCVSTQVGCAMGCVFCATGQSGYSRNLSSGEIVEQVLFFSRQLNRIGKKISNIVLMGMGEPFHNYTETMKAIDKLNDPRGMRFGARRITVSTVGLVPMINRFARESRQVNLAISLHAADNDLRSSLIPINSKYPLESLIEACHEYVQHTGRRITFEWALVKGVNDSNEQALKLASLLKGLICHVNIIPLNNTHGYSGRRSSHERVRKFKAILDQNSIPCTIRIRRGVDINAGCGQLASSK
jgi:23S rRNA (adenine2503-C2)-methyltransferase